jgi:hypothetical protein
MNKTPKISLNLGGLKLGAAAPIPESDKSEDSEKSGFGTFQSFGKINPTSKPESTEKTTSGFGKIEPVKSGPFKPVENEVLREEAGAVEKTEEAEMVVESTSDIAKVMGFSGFGDSKKAKQFDMSIIFEEARKKALDRNASNNIKLEEEGKACLSQDVVIHKFEKPNAEKKQQGPWRPPPVVNLDDKVDSDSDDEGFIGPPIPSSLSQEPGKLHHCYQQYKFQLC